MTFSSDSFTRNAAELDAAKMEHALIQAKRYIRFARDSNGANALRYSMEEYLRLQGVCAELIPSVCQKIRSKYVSK